MSDGRTPHYNRVLEFMLRAKQECPVFPTLPTADVRKLRAKLILEEALETIQALGIDVRLKGGFQMVEMDNLDFLHSREPNLIEIVDGCCDISVVTIGTLVAAGVRDEAALKCVDENNIAKFGPGCTIREDGKVIKPPNHRPPDIVRVIAEQTPGGFVEHPAASSKGT